MASLWYLATLHRPGLTWIRVRAAGLRARARGTDVLCHLRQSDGLLTVELFPRQAALTSQDRLVCSALIDLRGVDGREPVLRGALCASPSCCQPTEVSLDRFPSPSPLRNLSPSPYPSLPTPPSLPPSLPPSPRPQPTLYHSKTILQHAERLLSFRLDADVWAGGPDLPC